MEIYQRPSSSSSSSSSSILGKRKLSKEEKGMLGFSLEQLNQDLLEEVLSWLPTSTFLRLRSVCKRWSSISPSVSFRLACSMIPSREPWFLMVDRHLDQSFAFDTAEGHWIQNLKYPLLKQNLSSCCNNNLTIPVSASGGLVCFRNNLSGDLVICNPVNGSHRQLQTPTIQNNQPLHAISMISSHISNSYSLVLVFGEFPNLTAKVYNSENCHWEEDITLRRHPMEESGNSITFDAPGDDTIYFLSKAGDVVTTNMQRSQSKQYSSVITMTKSGEQIVYFLSSSGTIVVCNLAHKCFVEYPRLLPVFFEYSIDVVECTGEMVAVVLWEFLESASLRLWRFSEKDQCWQLVAAMPPFMSHELYGKKADINCAGCGDQILICVSSSDYNNYFLCNLVANEWTELPKCSINGKVKEFTSTFSFEPRIEAIV